MLTMSASAGGFTMPSETASAMETTSSAPFLCTMSAMAAMSSMSAEEVGRLDEHAGSVVVDGLVERFEIDASVLAVADVGDAAFPGSGRRWR